MKVESTRKLILFGPCSFWQSFWFCYKLQRAGLWYQVCRRPRSVAVRLEDLERASLEWVKLGYPPFGKDKTAE